MNQAAMAEGMGRGEQGDGAGPDSSALTGRRIGVTRAEQQLGEARRLFEAAGASVVDLPALAVTPPDDWGPLDDALGELEDFHWILFSSANGVEAVQQRLARRGGSLAHRPAGLRIAAVGRKTAAVLANLGAPADFVPPDFVADSLIEHFPVSGWGLRLLVPRVRAGSGLRRGGQSGGGGGGLRNPLPRQLAQRRPARPGTAAAGCDHLQQRQNGEPHLPASGAQLRQRLA